MFDRLTAMKEGGKSTGNGRRESYEAPSPYPRMTNTMIAPGDGSAGDVVKSLGKVSS